MNSLKSLIKKTKEYPLKIENVGGETYILMSRGHHDFNEFMDAVTRDYPAWRMGKPEHLWAKATPTRLDGYRCLYAIVPEGTKGAFPITHSQEDYYPEMRKEMFERLKRVYPEDIRPNYIFKLIDELSGKST